MLPRYSQMFSWGVTFALFSWILLFLYVVVDKKFPKIRLNVRKNNFFTIYLADFLIVTILSIIVGIRTNSGSDYYNYLVSFQHIDSWYSSFYQILVSRFQNGLYILMYLIKMVSSNEALFFMIYGLLNYIPVFYLIRKYSSDAILSFSSWLLLGFFLMSTNIMKQSLAMVLILLAFDKFVEKKYVRFALLALLASWFHISIIVTIGFIILTRYIKPSRNLFYGLSLTGLFFALFLKPILMIIARIANIRYISTYIYSFLNNGITETKLQIGAIVILFTYLVLLFALTNSKVVANLNPIYSKMVLVCLLALPFLIVSTKFYIFNRIAFTGLQLIIFLVPSIVKRHKLLLYSGLAIFGFLISILNADNNYYNYSTIFNDQPVSIQEFVRR